MSARQHHAPGNGTGHKAVTGRILLHIAGAPGDGGRPQCEADLGVMLSGKLVQLTGPRDFFMHLRKLRLAIDIVCKSLGFHDEFRVFDLIERTGAVGQLHPGLECAVTLTGHGNFPFAGVNAQALNRKRLAAHAPRRRHGGQSRLTRDLGIYSDRHNHVNQRIERRFFLDAGERGQGFEAAVKSRVLTLTALIRRIALRRLLC